MAKSYATQILRLAKTDADKVDVILSMWNNMALPALLYGMEVIPTQIGTINALNKWQSTIGKSALQLRSHTANAISNIDLGLKPIEMRLWSMQLKYYSTISNPLYNGSALVKLCLEYHTSLDESSPYIANIKQICNNIGVTMSPGTVSYTHLTLPTKA